MSAAGVVVYAWNPWRRLGKGPVTRRLPLPRRLNNFGDLLGPMIVRALASAYPYNTLGPNRPQSDVRSIPTLYSVGSVIHNASDGDIIWGSGVNGLNPVSHHRYQVLDVRAVRGPKTRQYLAQWKGVDAPEIYGDPGLLLPKFFPEYRELAKDDRERDLLVIPNMHDIEVYKSHPDFLSPLGRVEDVVSQIARSGFVVGSSLHAIVVADSLGIPARLIASSIEPSFKYEDYFLGSGREMQFMAPDVESAIRCGAHDPIGNFDLNPLIDAFPFDRYFSN